MITEKDKAESKADELIRQIIQYQPNFLAVNLSDDSKNNGAFVAKQILEFRKTLTEGFQSQD